MWSIVMSDTSTTSDLLPLTPAAAAAGVCRNHFHRLTQRQMVPPPVITEPVNRWSRRQIELWLAGAIRRNENGIWFEWNSEAEQFKKLPSQYVNILPQDAA